MKDSRLPNLKLSGLLLVFLLLLFPVIAVAAPNAATRIVTPTGWDAKIVNGNLIFNVKCNQNNPCKTINWAANVVASSGDTISVAAGTYAENISLAKNLTIVGAGSRMTIVDGKSAGSVFTIQTGANAQIKSLRIRNGKALQGGGINVANGGSLGLNGVTLQDNTAGAGGGIANYGNLTLSRVTLYRNHATSNTGGGLVNNGTATLDRTNVEVNDAQYGAGIYNLGILTLTNSAVFQNTTQNGYPGIYNSGGTLNLTNVTLSGNSTNLSSRDGGAISQFGGASTLNYVTITGNTQAHYGAIYTQNGSVVISNSLIFGNGANPQCGTFSIGTFTDGGYNVLADQSCSFFPGSGSLVANPKLMALAQNGGYTPTHALKSSSPAIDLVPKSRCLPQDQRGISRPIDGNGDGKAKCDAGAYEFP